MISPRELAGVRVTSDRLAVQVARLLCFAAAPALLILALRGVVRLAATPGEILLGVLAGGSLALLLVVLGLVLPLAVSHHEK